MAGLHENEICLRVVGLVPQKGKQYPPSAGLFYSFLEDSTVTKTELICAKT
jgi:hypothetical protein